MKALIVDDESKGRAYLSALLRKHCPEILFMEEAQSLTEAIDQIEKTSFDVVFLDINMPGGNGFDLLDRLRNWSFEIVFTTAYDNYAVQAFRSAAADYLLKPVQPEQLKEAVQRVQQKRQLVSGLQKSRQGKVLLYDGKDTHIVPVVDVVHATADGNYTWVTLTTGKRIHANSGLKEIHGKLPEDQFMRVHHSHIVQLDEIEQFNKITGELFLRNGERVQVSRSRKSDLLRILERTVQ